MKIAIHLGLGDTIACAAIIAKLAQENDIVEVPCWKHNEVSVRSFFVNIPNVIIESFESLKFYNEWTENANLKIGVYAKERGLYHNTPQLPNEDFVQWFYRQTGMDIAEKEKYCPIYEAAKLIIEEGESWFDTTKPFIHDDKSRGFVIDKHGWRPYHDPAEYDGSILESAAMLIVAPEIHCIDSSFLHLVECLPATGKLFYHKYARPNSTDYKYLKKEWNVIL